MGLFTKSLLIIIIAVSIPLVYRQFANDNTVKFMSQYYSNYKSIDQFLRQSARHLDQAKSYLPDSQHLKGVVEKVNKHINEFVKSTASKATEKTTENREEIKYRVVECSSEDLGGKEIRLWSKQELSKFDGSSAKGEILLAFLGIVYNVTMNPQHYGQGAEYNVFAGRDATRAFLTESWTSFYQGSYPIVGRIEGRFYDSKGCPTNELTRIAQVFVDLEQQKANLHKQETKFPECNSEWNGDLKKGRVWCSTKSGGIERDWAGVPRIYSENDVQRCACFNKDDPEAVRYNKFMSVYPNCDPESSECPLVQ